MNERRSGNGHLLKHWRQFSYLRSFLVEFPSKSLIFHSSALRLLHNSFITMFHTLFFPKLIHFG